MCGTAPRRSTFARGAGPLVVLVALFAEAAVAHVPAIAGRLIDCIQRSDVIVVGTVVHIADVDARIVEAAIDIDRTLLGAVTEAHLTFRGEARFAIKQRYVVFLRRDGAAFVGVQPSGTYFASAPADDALYTQVIGGIRAALAEKEETRVERIRAALIPGLGSAQQALSYNAALELDSLAHHGPLSAEQRAQVEAIMARPGIDPKLRSLVSLSTR